MTFSINDTLPNITLFAGHIVCSCRDMTFSLTTFGIMTFGITTLSIMSLNIKYIKYTQPNITL